MHAPAEVLDTEQETALARHLVRFADVLREVEADLLPHKLCEYSFLSWVHNMKNTSDMDAHHSKVQAAAVHH